VSTRIAPVVAEIANVSSKIPAILTPLMPIAAHLPVIGSNFMSVRTKFLLRGPFAPILAIFAHVRSGFTAVLPDLVPVRVKLSLVGTNFSAIGPQLSALCRVKPAAARFLREGKSRKTG
jgi:hypothetical protein